MADLSLSQKQLVEIAKFADSQRLSPTAEPKQLATILQIVTLCMHRLQAGEPPSVTGPEIDQWYDNEIGQNIRIMWEQLQLNPASDKLREIGVIS